MDDGRALAAELEDDRRQLLCRGRRHDLGDGRAAGEEDVIPLQLQKRGGHRRCALDHGKRIAVQILRDESRDHFGCGRRDFRGFDHSGVSSGYRRDQRGQRQHHRIVPRADDQADAEGIETYPDLGRGQQGWRVERYWLHPLS